MSETFQIFLPMTDAEREVKAVEYTQKVYRETIPSFLNQTPWKAGYFDFPPEPNVRHFNPSICQRNDHQFLCTRRSFGHPKPFGQNTLVLWELDENKKPSLPAPLRFMKTHCAEQWEDPRLVVFDNQIFVSLTNFKIVDYKAHQLLARIAQPFCEHIHPLYGGNGPNMIENLGNEKNWGWFDHPDGWHFVYHPWPHHVVRTNKGEAACSYVEPATECPWSHGEMRGGSPPVLVDDLYWCFFHSSTPWIEPKKRYHMGAYAFESKPPFSIKMVTIDPILSGSIEDGGQLPCIFPGGAVYNKGKWLVVFGVNDFRAGYCEIPEDELLERMALI